jgi:hypothetical protein
MVFGVHSVRIAMLAKRLYTALRGGLGSVVQRGPGARQGRRHLVLWR